MRRFLTAAFLVAIVGAGGACTEPAKNTVPPGTVPPGTSGAPAVASSPSASADVGNTKQVCTAVKTLVSDENLDALGKNLGTLATARRLKDAQLEATTKTAIQTQAGASAKQLNDLQQQATDPTLKSALGAVAVALTTLGTDQTLAGINSVEDAAKAINALGSASDSLSKACS
jgi:hypothetical protein